MNTKIFVGREGRRVVWTVLALGIASGPCAHAGREELHSASSSAAAAARETVWRESQYVGRGYRDTEFQVEEMLRERLGVSAQRLRFPVRGPLLGQPLPPVLAGKVGETAARLQPYVAESFFAPLSLLLAEGPLSPKRTAMLEQYRTLKLEAVKRLRAELDAVEAVRPPERLARLAAFAQDQAAAVEEVEAQAEAIRQELFRTRWLESGADWDNARESQQAARAPKTPEEEQLELLQLAAAFGPELSREQRGLLQDASMEIVDRVRGVSDPAFLCFTPSNSRIRLPDGMSESLARRVAAYRELKGALIEELRSAVFGQRRSGEHERTAAFGALRAAQAEGIAKLERLAEEIRAELAGSPPPVASPIPADLAPRITDYLGAKVEAQQAFVVKLAEVRAALPNVKAEVVPAERGYRIEVDAAGVPTRKGEAVLASLPAFHEEQTRRYTELVAKRKALLQALKDVPGQPLQGSARSVDDLLQEFAAAQVQQENWNKYVDYRRAVLEPGLSAGQRRILFSAAVETLVAPYYR